MVQVFDDISKSRSDTKQIKIPKGSSKWLFASPYSLDSQIEKLGLELKESGKKQLLEANRMDENVLLAEIDKSCIIGIHILDSEFDVSSAVLIFLEGESVYFKSRDSGRPIIITKNQ